MIERRIDWEEAERWMPGITAEWQLLTVDGSHGYRLGPHLNDPSHPVEVWLVSQELSSYHFIEVRAHPLTPYPCDGGELIEWASVPSWRRFHGGDWISPFPIPRKLADWRTMEYKYRLPCKGCGQTGYHRLDCEEFGFP